MEAVNELDYILQFLDAHGIDMHMIARDLNRDYDYIKGQKTQKDPAKQSKKLIKNVKTRYVEVLKDMPAYPKPYTSTEPNLELREDPTKYNRSSDLANNEEDRQDIDIENNQLLHIIKNQLQTSLTNQEAIARYLAKKDSNGDEQKEKEILEQLKHDAASSAKGTNDQDAPAQEH